MSVCLSLVKEERKEGRKHSIAELGRAELGRVRQSRAR